MQVVCKGKKYFCILYVFDENMDKDGKYTNGEYPESLILQIRIKIRAQPPRQRRQTLTRLKTV